MKPKYLSHENLSPQVRPGRQVLPTGAAEREGVQPGGESEEHQDRGDPGASQTAQEHRGRHQRRHAGQSLRMQAK